MSSIDAGHNRLAPITWSMRRLILGLTWLSFAISGIVLSEPTAHDALMVGLIVLLPLSRLTRMTPLIGVYAALWLLIVAGGFIASTQAGPIGRATGFMGVTLYLALASVVIAAFVAADPVKHLRLIFSAYMVAALIGAFAAIAGYFSLVPGAFDVFMEWGARARGTFKDPNVLGAFLAPAIVYCFYRTLTERLLRAMVFVGVMLVLTLAVMLTFSRGAMFNTAVSLTVFAFLTLATARTNRERVKLVLFGMLGAALVTGLLAMALQSPSISKVLTQRSTLTQSYDEGPEGRFGGQVRAVETITTHPLGLGGLEFGRVFNKGADIHNVYLSMFINAGWLGGLLYFVTVITTLALGFARAIQPRRSLTDGIVIAVFAATVGMVLEGFIVDTDHWRHFYLLFGLVWGVAAAAHAPARPSSASAR